MTLRCLIHGREFKYDMKSGFELCPDCEAEPKEGEEMSNPQMPYSPLDALINCLHDVRKAGRVKPGDTVGTVDQRIADVFLPIVKRIQQEARKPLLEALKAIAQKDPQGFTCGPNAPATCENRCIGCLARAAILAAEKD